MRFSVRRTGTTRFFSRAARSGRSSPGGSKGRPGPGAPRSVLRRRRGKRNGRLLLRRPRRDEKARARHAGPPRGREIAAIDGRPQPERSGLADRENLVFVELQNLARPRLRLLSAGRTRVRIAEDVDRFLEADELRRRQEG